ncbi:MAG: aminotransferase class IV [Flavobacteriaceae bacterium]|nr:aminotransferase class IV [Flavobacteriaceae bacterium]
MININGTIQEDSKASISINNRGFNYGDAVFETIRVYNKKVLFWEDHYFRLMASMRILRMDIPMSFTPEFLESEIVKLVETSERAIGSCRIKLVVNRKIGGLYAPQSNDVDYFISVKPLESDIYQLTDTPYVVDLFKDYYVTAGLLATLKTNNRALNVIAGIYAEENGYNNCLLLNEKKNVVEAINANVFLVKGNVLKTPPILDGCLKGVMRKQILDIVQLMPDYEIEETSVSPFELQKADEIFLTNVISGIVPITQYRKKIFTSNLAKNLIGKLNLKIRLG